MKRIIEIGGMGCMKCVNLVTEILKDYEGIDEVVTVEVGKAAVIINDRFDPKKVEELLTEEEFDVISVHGE